MLCHYAPYLLGLDPELLQDLVVAAEQLSAREQAQVGRVQLHFGLDALLEHAQLVELVDLHRQLATRVGLAHNHKDLDDFDPEDVLVLLEAALVHDLDDLGEVPLLAAYSSSLWTFTGECLS